MSLFLSNLLNNYYTFFYGIQKNLSNLFFFLSSLGNIYVFIFIFFIGVFTMLTPCFISILPLALSYINLNSSTNIISFILGIFTTLVLLITSTNFLSFSFLVHRLPIISYCFLIIVALNLMQLLNFPDISSFFDKYFNRMLFNNILIKSYMVGFIISSSVLPCSTSSLLIFTFILQSADNILYSIFYLSIYLLGVLTPLLLLLKIKLINVNVSVLLYLWKFLFPISGSFLFILSLFSVLKIIFT